MKQMKHSHERNTKGLAKLLRWLPAVLWMSVIFWLSSRTGEELGSVLPLFQLLLPMMESFDWGHFVAYYILALTYAYGFGRRSQSWGMKLLIILLCLLYGVTDEYHQSFVDDRTPDIADLRNDTIGAALAMLSLQLPFVRKAWRKIVD
ncbi:VanZ family protein [Paenibacillus sp. SYP-B4298]|uniref:VanZ family protein n=1 Tax=Paenibacillus sp. SYP-B4298 TaxID=2996034 RepID=UPI0022DCE5D8|nr:VanZ family protein [Paenibacillus sp. SYP-B4298]